MMTEAKEAAMKRVHLLPCPLAIGVALVVLVAFGFDGAGVATAALLLVCPLMMFGMMFFMRGGHEHGHDTEHRDRDSVAR
jgi:hypothetical protein